MKITFSEIRKKRFEKKNNHIFNLLKINNDKVYTEMLATLCESGEME